MGTLAQLSPSLASVDALRPNQTSLTCLVIEIPRRLELVPQTLYFNHGDLDRFRIVPECPRI